MSTESYQAERARPPYWIALAALAFGFAIFFMAAVIVQAIGGSASGTPGTPPAVNIIDNFIFDASFVLAALYFTVVRGVMGRADFGYRRIPWRTGIAAVLLAGAIYYPVTFGYAALLNLHGSDKLPSGLGIHKSHWDAAAVAIYVCAVAPMAEEFFFRGFLFGILRNMQIKVGQRELGPWVAALIVGVLFGLAHFDSAQPQYLVPLGFLGFLLCIVRWRTRSLYPGMALHSINNCLAFGVSAFAWNAGQIVALSIGALALIALVTGPLSIGIPPVRRSEPATG